MDSLTTSDTATPEQDGELTRADTATGADAEDVDVASAPDRDSSADAPQAHMIAADAASQPDEAHEARKDLPAPADGAALQADPSPYIDRATQSLSDDSAGTSAPFLARDHDIGAEAGAAAAPQQSDPSPAPGDDGELTPPQPDLDGNAIATRTPAPIAAASTAGFDIAAAPSAEVPDREEPDPAGQPADSADAAAQTSQQSGAPDDGTAAEQNQLMQDGQDAVPVPAGEDNAAAVPLLLEPAHAQGSDARGSDSTSEETCEPSDAVGDMVSDAPSQRADAITDSADDVSAVPALQPDSSDVPSRQLQEDQDEEPGFPGADNTGAPASAQGNDAQGANSQNADSQDGDPASEETCEPSDAVGDMVADPPSQHADAITDNDEVSIVLSPEPDGSTEPDLIPVAPAAEGAQPDVPASEHSDVLFDTDSGQSQLMQQGPDASIIATAQERDLESVQEPAQESALQPEPESDAVSAGAVSAPDTAADSSTEPGGSPLAHLGAIPETGSGPEASSYGGADEVIATDADSTDQPALPEQVGAATSDPTATPEPTAEASRVPAQALADASSVIADVAATVADALLSKAGASVAQQPDTMLAQQFLRPDTETGERPHHQSGIPADAETAAAETADSTASPRTTPTPRDERAELIRRRWMETGSRMWNPKIHGTGNATLTIQGRVELLAPAPGESLPRYDRLEFRVLDGHIVCEGIAVEALEATDYRFTERAGETAGLHPMS